MHRYTAAGHDAQIAGVTWRYKKKTLSPKSVQIANATNVDGAAALRRAPTTGRKAMFTVTGRRILNIVQQFSTSKITY